MDKIMNMKREILAFAGLLFMFSYGCVLYAAFLYAWVQGGICKVSIDSIGEAWIEFIVFPITMVVGLFSILHYWRKW